jgi:hypothetical protein
MSPPGLSGGRNVRYLMEPGAFWPALAGDEWPRRHHLFRPAKGRAVMRALTIAATLFAPARAREIGARLPIQYGEIFAVRNEAGIKN